MAKKTEEAPVRRRSGCLGVLTKIFVITGVLALAAPLTFIYLPQDLSDVEGNEPGPATTPWRDIKSVLKSSIERGYEVTLTESEINRYLARTLGAKQGGPLGGSISLDHVWVRLEDGYAEVIMERRIFGRPFTTSCYVQVSQIEETGGPKTEIVRHGGPYIEDIRPNRGGRFGRLVVPEGFIYLVQSSFQKLAGAYEEELDLGFAQMARVSIKESGITFNPHAPGDSLTTPGSTF